MSSGYGYSVYTTWETSIKEIEEMSDKAAHSVENYPNNNVLFPLRRHYRRDIRASLEESPWLNSFAFRNSSYMQSQEGVEDWDPIMIRETAVLPASFSLLKIDETGCCMSMHPLVHVWARDRLSRDLQGHSLDLSYFNSICRCISGIKV